MRLSSGIFKNWAESGLEGDSSLQSKDPPLEPRVTMERFAGNNCLA